MSMTRDIIGRIEGFAKNSDIRLYENNRWVASEALIPWARLEAECGDAAQPAFRQLFAACLIQAKHNLGDDETIMQIQESPYLQYFCGMSGFDGCRLPFGEDELVGFREKLGVDLLDKINGIIGAAKRK